MTNDQKDVNGGTATDDISGVARIWCEGTKRDVDGEGHKTEKLGRD